MKKLKNRHLQMIALGGTIGTGLFFGLTKSIPQTGSSIILSYLIGGLVMYIIMRALGEMVVYEPNSGAFSYYANKYVGSYLGFLSGWYAWFEYTIVCMLEITAVTVFLDLWIPYAPHWLVIAIILSIFFIINTININIFGEFEFWFASIKLAVIIVMIIFALYLMFFNPTIKANTLTNIAVNVENNVFAGGLKGFMFSLVLVVFSFGGAQFIGIAAADAENPQKAVPSAIRGVMIRTILFYIGTVSIILCLYPWVLLSANISPFVDVFTKIGIPSAALVMNIVAIIAALSAFNSCLYAGSRMLSSLAKQGLAPYKLGVLNKKNIPHNAVVFTSIVVAATVIINYLFPQKAIIYLIAIAATSIIVTWSTILVCHIYFRLKNPNQSYRLPLFPFSNIFSIIILLLVIVTMAQMDDMKLAVYLMPLWIFILSVLYFVRRKFLFKKV